MKKKPANERKAKDMKEIKKKKNNNQKKKKKNETHTETKEMTSITLTKRNMKLKRRNWHIMNAWLSS